MRTGAQTNERRLQSKLPTVTAGERALTAAAVAAAAAALAVFARTRFVYIQRATIEVFAVEGRHCGIGLGFVIHGDERKTARFAGHAVHHQRDFANLAVLFKKILQIVFGGLKREITNV